jgi:hypothetical protein
LAVSLRFASEESPRRASDFDFGALKWWALGATLLFAAMVAPPILVDAEMHKPVYSEGPGSLSLDMLDAHLPEAGRTLADLQRRFAGTHHDTMIGLRCKLEIRRGEIKVAEALWNQLREKGTGVHLGLRLALLNRKAPIRAENAGAIIPQ